MLRLIVILTVILTLVGLPQVLQPLLMSGPPRLVMFNTGEEPYVINPEAPERVQLPEEVVKPAVQTSGPDLTAIQSWAELVMHQRS